MESGRSQELIKKPHFQNGSTKISVLEVRIDSMQHFSPLFLFGVPAFTDPCWVGWGRCIRADFFFSLKVQGLNSVPIQWFCLYTLLRCCRAKDLSHVGEMRGPSIRRPTALTDRKPHLDFRCMFEPFCQFAALWLKDVSWCMKNRLSITNLI